MAMFNSFLYVYQRVRWKPPAMAAWILQRTDVTYEIPMSWAAVSCSQVHRGFLLVALTPTIPHIQSPTVHAYINPHVYHVSWFRVLNPQLLTVNS